MTLDKAIYLNVVFMLPFISVNAPLLDVTVIYGAAYCRSDSVLQFPTSSGISLNHEDNIQSAIIFLKVMTRTSLLWINSAKCKILLIQKCFFET